MSLNSVNSCKKTHVPLDPRAARAGARRGGGHVQGATAHGQAQGPERERARARKNYSTQHVRR